MTHWLDKTGPDNDIALSTRVRLARNLDGIPFPGHMNPQQEERVLADTARIVTSDGQSNIFSLHKLDALPPVEVGAMVERHLISTDLARNRHPRGVIVSGDESVSVMVGEEDHLRIQAMGAGLCLSECMEQARKLDELIERELPYAFDEQLGYLTTCPTNLGTALRVSVMLHLPATAETGEMRGVVATLPKMGLTARGAYGEGSEALGQLFQVSNQITLGLSEEDIIARLNSAVQRLISQERALRGRAAGTPALQLEDRVFRAMGILQNARRISSEEAMHQLSNARVGVSLGLVDQKYLPVLNQLVHDIQPASLVVATGKNLTASERDVQRAKWMRDKLANA